MDLYKNARTIAEQVLTQKWNAQTALDELTNSHIKINSIVMGASNTFSFDVYLPSGRVHKFSVKDSDIQHKIVNP